MNFNMLLMSLLPKQASTGAAESDFAFWVVFWICVFFGLIIIPATIYFAIRYRKKGKPGLTNGPTHSTFLEFFWTAVPTLMIFFIFVIGFVGFMDFYVAPSDAEEIRVTGRQWSWTFSYANGSVEYSELTVPIGRPIKLVMSSEDVIHSVYIPVFRVKMDTVPNRYSSLWFEATEIGSYDLYCTEYCGDAHSRMVTKVNVVSEEDYQKFLKDNQGEKSGEQLYTLRGCVACHSLDGSPKIGPSWKGIYGTERPLANGSSVIADDNYIKQSIIDPNSQVVKGYPAAMPAYVDMPEEEINAIIDFMKELK